MPLGLAKLPITLSVPTLGVPYAHLDLSTAHANTNVIPCNLFVKNLPDLLAFPSLQTFGVHPLEFLPVIALLCRPWISQEPLLPPCLTRQLFTLRRLIFARVLISLCLYFP
jgi:hypothetical protein